MCYPCGYTQVSAKLSPKVAFSVEKFGESSHIVKSSSRVFFVSGKSFSPGWICDTSCAPSLNVQSEHHCDFLLVLFCFSSSSTFCFLVILFPLIVLIFLFSFLYCSSFFKRTLDRIDEEERERGRSGKGVSRAGGRKKRRGRRWRSFHLAWMSSVMEMSLSSVLCL